MLAPLVLLSSSGLQAEYSITMESAWSAYNNGDKESACMIWLEIAKTENAIAQNNVATCFQEGLSFPRDISQALYWFEKAASTNDSLALKNLAFLYFNGEDVTKDLGLAFSYAKRSAALGDPRAQALLGDMYANGYGRDLDQNEALNWYLKSAEGGYDYAQNRVGIYYEQGIGTKRDLAKAKEWYETAARGGHSYAQNNLGQLYGNGMGVPKDYGKAVYWYKKAIASDPKNERALWNLSIMFEYGYGVKKDVDLANTLIIMSAKAGDAQAIAIMKDSHGADWDEVTLKPSAEMRFGELVNTATQSNIEDPPGNTPPSPISADQSKSPTSDYGSAPTPPNSALGSIIRSVSLAVLAIGVCIPAALFLLTPRRKDRKTSINATKFAARPLRTSYHSPPFNTANITQHSSPGSHDQERHEGTCWKCGHQRKDSDDGPLWQCPSCGAAYNKMGQTAARSAQQQLSAVASDETKRPQPIITSTKIIGIAASTELLLILLLPGLLDMETSDANIFWQTIKVGISFWCAHLIWNRKNWARITYLILFALSLPLTLLALVGVILAAPALLFAFFPEVLKVFALLNLFKPESRNWFKGN